MLSTMLRDAPAYCVPSSKQAKLTAEIADGTFVLWFYRKSESAVRGQLGDHPHAIS